MTDLPVFDRITFSTGAFEVNTSIVKLGDRIFVIDPGAEPERIIERLDGITPCAILLTHAHFDHVGAVNALQRRFPELPVYIGTKDVDVLTHPMNQYPPDYPPIERPLKIRAIDESNAPIEGIFKVLDTPGHTPGGVVYYLEREKLLFAGDTLFAGSIGRTDLPGGDAQTLFKSLGKLRALPSETRVVPGHGPETTIGAELKTNPFFR